MRIIRRRLSNSTGRLEDQTIARCVFLFSFGFQFYELFFSLEKKYTYFAKLDLLDPTAVRKLSNIDKRLFCNNGSPLFTPPVFGIPNYIQNIGNATKFKKELYMLFSCSFQHILSVLYIFYSLFLLVINIFFLFFCFKYNFHFSFSLYFITYIYIYIYIYIYMLFI